MARRDEYGPAGEYLEALRVVLAGHSPPIHFGGWTVTGAMAGGCRFMVAPRVSVYVEAPVTPAGNPRVHGERWRYRKGRGRKRGGSDWQHADTLDDIVDAICEISRVYWGEHR